MDVGRWSKLARTWALLVKERDNWTCSHCGSKDRSELQAHHIVPWNKNEELRFVLENGLTLCKRCHSKEDKRIADFKIGEWSKGRKYSDDHKQKLSDAHKGQIAWNKGLKGVQSSTRKGTKQAPRTEEVKKKIGDATRGRSWVISPETGKRMWIDK